MNRSYNLLVIKVHTQKHVKTEQRKRNRMHNLLVIKRQTKKYVKTGQEKEQKAQLFSN